MIDGEMVDAADLAVLARSDPRRALTEARLLLGSTPQSSHAERSALYRSMSVAARTAASLFESVCFAEASIEEAMAGADPDLESRAKLTLAGSLALSGRHREALAVLEGCPETSDASLMADIQFQKGAILGRMGRVRQALAAFDRAMPTFEAVGDRESTAQTLLNRGMLALSAGDLDAAGADLEGARALYEELGHRVDQAGADHNLGILAARRGDIPEAMRRFNRSESTLLELTGSGSDVRVSRVELLLSAGLAREALDVAIELDEELTALGQLEDAAEATLAAAQAALACGDAAGASTIANRARLTFTSQGRPTWAAAAELVELQGRYAEGSRRLDLMRRARALASAFEVERQHVPAFNARLLAGRICLERKLVSEAQSELAPLTNVKLGPVEMRLQAWLARCLLAEATDRPRQAEAAARSGMDLLLSYQSAIGASDIRHGLQTHIDELAGIGFRIVLASGKPQQVFSWMERQRSGALLHRPVAPPDDAEQARALAELRRITERLRGAPAEEVAALERSQRAVQDSISRRARAVEAPGGAEGEMPSPATVSTAIGDGALVALAGSHGQVWAVTAVGSHFALASLGEEADLAREHESLRFTMRRLARGRGSVAMAEAVAARLDEMIFAPLDLPPGPLLVVPPPRLHALPWKALPSCRDRPVVVAPSARLWLQALSGDRAGNGVLVAAGPDLAMADAEVKAVARLYPGSTRLDSRSATVGSVHAGLDGARIAHVASHAFFQFENPMFSCLRLADGDLNVYDIERLRTSPEVVVLSACDSGFTDTHAGEELMGLSSALLSMGTRSIIASVGLVPDSQATKELMLALHRGLISGLTPSHALHRAQAEVRTLPGGYVAAGSFICIGAG